MVSEEVPEDFMTTWCQSFADEMYDWSDGQIEITVYPYGTLGGLKDIQELCQMGEVQFSMTDAGWNSVFVPTAQVICLHYLWPREKSVETMAEVIANGKVMDLLRPKFREKGFELLAFLDEGWNLISSNKSLRTPADWKNLKFRVPGSPVQQASYKAYSCDAVTCGFGEIYGALQTGLIDAQVQPMYSHYSMRFHEQQDYFTNMYNEMFMAIPLANRAFFDTLPEDIQNKIRAVWADYVLPAGLDGLERTQESINLVKVERPEITFYDFTAEEMKPFNELAIPVRDEYVEIGGEGCQEILDVLLADIEAAKAKLGVE